MMSIRFVVLCLCAPALTTCAATCVTIMSCSLTALADPPVLPTAVSDHAIEPRQYRLTMTGIVTPDAIRGTGVVTGYQYAPCRAPGVTTRSIRLRGALRAEFSPPESLATDALTASGREHTFAIPVALASSSFEVASENIESYLEMHRGNPPWNAGELQRATASFQREPGPDEAMLQWTLPPSPVMHSGYELYTLMFRVQRTVTCYNLRFNDRDMLNHPWPGDDAWKHNVAPYLEAERYIESDSPQVKSFVTELTNDKPRMVSPYLLGKILAKASVTRIQVGGVESERLQSFFAIPFETDRARLRESRRPHLGLVVQGASRTLESNQGSLHDLVCTFVAACRASGLAARPVIGFEYKHEDEIFSWAEFYVPGQGWMPVDFRELESGPGTMHTFDRAWEGFGSNDDLHDLIPLAYRFQPTGAYATANDQPLLWGAAPYIRMPTAQAINLDAQFFNR